MTEPLKWVTPTGTVSRRMLLDAIREFTEKHGYPPSYRQLAARTGLALTSVKYHLDVLQDMKKISRDPNIARSITIL